MRITVTARHLVLTDALRRYAREKVVRLQRFMDRITSAHVVLSIQKHRQIAEVTLHVRDLTIRGEESSHDLYVAIDRVADKIERQIVRYKEKIAAHVGRASGRWRHSQDVASTEAGQFPENGPRIVRTKRFAMKPLVPEEASIHMELLGHNFFVFRNARTDEFNVLYRRQDGNYGLIEPGG